MIREGGLIGSYQGIPIFSAGLPRYQVGDELVFDQDPKYSDCIFKSAVDGEHIRMSGYKYQLLVDAGFRGTVISIDEDTGMYEMGFAGEGFYFPECMVLYDEPKFTMTFTDISEDALTALLE